MAPIFTLGKRERLKSRKQIGKIFSEGKSQYVYPIKLMFILEKSDHEDWPLKFSVTVPKKKIKSAPRRNLIKRRCREAYRLNKSDLEALLKNRHTKLSLMFIYLDTEAKNYSVIEKSIKKHLSELLFKVSEFNNDLPA